jgi:hypothetical protein
MNFCTNDRMDRQPISERIKHWKTLHPGESLPVTASRRRLNDRNEGLGTYEFWVSSLPPLMEQDERKALLDRGIQFPRKVLDSNHIVLVKRN